MYWLQQEVDIMAVNKFHYPQTLSLYDSEGRDRKGYVETYQRYGTDAGRYYDFTGSYYQYFFLDFTNNTDWVTVLELSNGVKMQCKSRNVVTPTGGVQVVYVDYRYLSSDGRSSIGGGYSTVSLDTGHYSDISNVKTLVTYDKVYYYGDTTLSNVAAYSASVGFTLWLEKTNETGLYPAPTQKYARDFWWANYNYIECNLGNANDDAGLQNLINQLNEIGDGTIITPILPSDDTSSTGGGDAGNPDYNPFSDPVDFPDLPTYGPINTGLITAYKPSIVQLRLLASKLWSDDFVNEIKKINNDPMEAVISLHQLPFHINPATSQNCVIGNYDSEISMATIANQFLNISGGSFQVNERFASALDYSPYTSAHIHIPFVGIIPVDIDYIMKKRLVLNYQVDVLTGSAVAMLKCDNAILYTFPCNMAITTPLTSSNHQALYREIIQTSASVGHTIVAGATGGRTDGGGLTQGAKAGVGHGIVSSLESALNTVASKHSEVQKSGSITGVQGILDSYETYLIFHRPIQSLAQNFAHFKGFPCNITYTLSALSGYTEVEYAHLEGVTATDEEKNEIQMLLQTGVIL